MDNNKGEEAPTKEAFWTVEAAARLGELLVDGEKIIAKAPSDLSLDGNYHASFLVLTNKRLVSLDDTHEDGYLIVHLDRVERVNIERMYGNSIFQVVVNGEVIDLNRFSNSFLDYFENIAVKIDSKEISDEADPYSEYSVNNTGSKHRCPKCGRTLASRNSVCMFCVDKKKVVRRLLTYVKPFTGLTMFVLVLALLTTLIPLIPPYMTKILVDDVLPHGDLNRLWIIVGILLGLYTINAILSGFRGYYLRKLSEGIIFKLRTGVFAKIQYLPVEYYDKRSTGSIMSRISSDTQRLQTFLINLTQNIIIQVLTLVIIMVIMFSMHWQLALLSVTPIPIVVVGSKIYASKMKPRYRRIWRRMSRMNTILGDTIPGVKVIKAFLAENRVVNQYTEQGQDLVAEQLGAAKMSNIFSPLITFLVMVGGLLIWAVGGYWVISSPDKLSIGVLVAFISYVGRFYTPVSFFANFNDQVQQAVTSAERVFEIFDTDPEPDEGKGNIIEGLKGKIEFRNVEFYYEKSNTVLNNVSFKVEPGETIGIVGPTGSGKSTIANLLMRYYDCTDGQILIDGHDIKTIDKEFLRGNIGYVLQEPLLFRDTITNNISYSKPEASIEEIITAAKIANAHGFISRFPDAYDTILGERGTGLSGGEKQRVSIARAIIKNPRILILDEATSAVDTETEKLIQAAIDRLIENRTTIIIAHRLSTLRKADKILVLEEGKVVEYGTQNELIEKQGRYYHLVKLQTDMGIDVIDYNRFARNTAEDEQNLDKLSKR